MQVHMEIHKLVKVYKVDIPGYMYTKTTQVFM